MDSSTVNTQICTKCSENINFGDIYITASRSPSKVWHPSCFTCATCNDILVDLVYFFSDKNGQIYCGRHYAELMIPRCSGCDEVVYSSNSFYALYQLIVADSITLAEDNKWHKEHFCCQICDVPLQGKQYTIKQGSVICQPCHDKAADDCHRCHLPVYMGSRKITKRKLIFHEECFVCKRCRESLWDRKNYFAEGDFLCDECMQPIAQCFACKECIMSTEMHMKFESRTWHINCFACSSCKTSLKDSGFHDYAGSLVCAVCYTQKTSKRCNVCQKPIVGKGVQWNFSVFHLECFQCSSCEKHLSGGEKLSEEQGHLFCQSCALKFAKVCESCHEPISGRHTIYKKKMYHLNCFKCTQCGIAIGKQSFFETSLKDVLCEPCAGRNH